MEAIPSWSTADCFSQLERVVLAYTDALVLNGGRVSDTTFAALQAALSDEEILELTYTVALYKMQAIMSQPCAWSPMTATIRSGARRTTRSVLKKPEGGIKVPELYEGISMTVNPHPLS